MKNIVKKLAVGAAVVALGAGIYGPAKDAGVEVKRVATMDTDNDRVDKALKVKHAGLLNLMHENGQESPGEAGKTFEKGKAILDKAGVELVYVQALPGINPTQLAHMYGGDREVALQWNRQGDGANLQPGDWLVGTKEQFNNPQIEERVIDLGKLGVAGMEGTQTIEVLQPVE